jgi:geranylgeranyl diphosphate synthase, type II
MNGAWRDALARATLALLPGPHADPDLDAFHRLQRDYPLRGGKGLRGLFVMASCAAHGGDPEQALAPAAALELFQNWVLVHDDIEDDSDERRGRPALHRLVGTPVALNVGDAMHVWMWQALIELPNRPGFLADAIRREFARLIHRTAEGQHLDLTWVAQGRFDVDPAAYLRMVTLKTSWYTVIGPLRLGAFAAGIATPAEAFTSAGERLGAAFQIRDDVLNLDPTAATGKEFAGDLREGKRTLILAHAFARSNARERAEAEARLRLPRPDKSDADVAWLLAWIDAHDARSSAQAVAEREAAAAIDALAACTRDLPGRAARDELLGALSALAQRTS